jgi:excisionase family DNA binding protein
MPDREDAAEISVLDAARVLGRHPETIRRWVWTGRLAARREGNRLLLDRAQLASIAAEAPGGRVDLKEWTDRLGQREHGRSAGARSGSAADLVIGDRRARSRESS